MSQPQDERRTGGSQAGVTGRVLFARFELDLDTGELSREGSFVPLQAQAAKVLVHLAARAGRLVPRRDLIELLWPDRIVEYDQGLNSVVRTLRGILGDDPQAPRFIETLPRQGYRFVAPVSSVPPASDAGRRHLGRHWLRPLPVVLSVLAVLLATASLWIVLRSPAGHAPVLAVLPFSGDDPEAGALGASLASELVRELVAVPAGSLQVVGETSAVRASAESREPTGAGIRLGATHVVTGTVAPEESRVALEISLLRVSDGRVLLTESLAPSWSELLTAQREIARRLAARVTRRIEGTGPLHLATPALAPEVLEDYLYGRYLLAKGAPESTAEAAARLRSVVKAAPRFARGRVAFAEALLSAGEANAPSEARMQSVEALRLDPRDARAHLLRARLALAYEWDWGLAGRHLDRARQLAPGDPLVHLARAAHAASLGRHAEALAAVAAAKRLDPLSATVQGDLAMFHYWAGDLEGVLTETERLLEREPEHRAAKSLRLEALFDSGRWEEARALATSLTGENQAFLAVPSTEIENRYLAVQEARWSPSPPSALRSMVLASVAARRGEHPDAIAHLEEAIHRHSPYVPFLFVDPDFRPLRSEAIFQRLLADVGHPRARQEPEQTARHTGSIG